MEGEVHIPVMLSEAVDGLAVKPGGRYVDGTFGRGGHSREILRRGGAVLGIDRDDTAVAAGMRMRSEVRGQRSEIRGQRSEVEELRLRVVKGCHGNLKEIANENGWNEVDGILLDLGVSSPQLDEAGRGFSFLRDGPLDMRMDRSGGVTAADLVNGESAERLTEIFRDWGEEPSARQIARAICRARSEVGGQRSACGKRRFETTGELAEFVERTVGRHGGKHPATRVFQALRMAVNDETGELERALAGGLDLLKPGGRFAVITFESITDRLVKRFFAAHAGRMVSLQQGGEEWRGVEPRVRAVTRKAVTASAEELERNVRSRSAKLRVVEKI